MIPRDANRRRVFLMRHGSVTYFDASGKPIPPDTAPLNEKGKHEAKATGQVFARANARFDRVIVSGLQRTVETAHLVLEQVAQSIPLDVNVRLQEIRGGALADIPAEDLQSAFLGAFEGMVPESTRFLGGESVGELLDRVTPEIDALRADPTWDIVLLVLHGGVNRAILSYLLTGERSLMAHFAQAPACVNVLDVGNAKGDVVLRAINVAPTDLLQTETRKTTMETLYEQYAKYRSRFGERLDV
jgi:broad specificity phosphatase PhoE